MYFKDDCFGIICDNCQKTLEDGYSGYSMFVDENQAHEYADNAEWHLLDKHYCPDCFTIDDEDILHVNAERTKPPNTSSEPSSIPVVDIEMYMVTDDLDFDLIAMVGTKNIYLKKVENTKVVDYEKEEKIDLLQEFTCILHGRIELVDAINQCTELAEKYARQMSSPSDQKVKELIEFIESKEKYYFQNKEALPFLKMIKEKANSLIQ